MSDPHQRATRGASALVIIGSGLAAWSLAREFRKLDARMPVTLITRDSGDYYSKPMLSNALSNGKTAAQLISATRSAMAEQLDVNVMAFTQVTAIDPIAHTVSTTGGTVAYRRLVLATGSDPLRLSLQGDAVDQVLSVNDLADYARFRETLANAERVTIIGAGLIGCEFANDLARAGYLVDVVAPDAQPLSRLIPPEVGARVRDALSCEGVRFRLGVSVNAVYESGQGVQLELGDGERLTTQVVLSAVGLRPRTDLARTAGLQTNRGIVVNRQLQSSEPDIYALGDVAEVEGQLLPFVMPLLQSARTLAAHLAGQEATLRYPAMPIVVKTPAIPVVASPPATGAAGTWTVDSDAEGIVARFADEHDNLLGFALTGKAIAQKTAFLNALPPTLA
ncbi:FAD-dependent oxidoreductase [Propionivibrio soli]|uniref:FAD-dependent oxidoreductase n=1 Tax=Propionivibrio soli TaxID=2976531 RepID=UPI0021E95095|nr:FAD-dependent oxidoreductase [Propionivibrio soli]